VCNITNANNLVVKNGTCNAIEEEDGYSVVDIKCYPKYSSTVLNTNLALIKINVSAMIREQHTIHPICLANDKSKRKVKVEEQVMFFIWGNSVGSLFNIINTTVVHGKECKPSFVREGLRTFKGKAVFCAYGNTTTFCNGNIGAGVVATANNGYVLLKGVINRATKDCGRPGSFIALSRLNFKKVRQWIKNTTKS